jgi:GNAT superfamily N-acetyltransferase
MTQKPQHQPDSLTDKEIPELIDLVDSVMREGSDQSMGTDYPLVFRKENLSNIHVIKEQGKIVAEVPYIPRTIKMGEVEFRIGIISATSTHPEHRKKGYALACLNANVEKMEKEGIELSVLWTVVPTFYFYNHCDFQAIRKQMSVYLCHKRDAFAFTDYDYEIVSYNPHSRDYLDQIISMHEKDDYRTERDEDTYKGYFSLPKMTTWVALDQGKPAGYLIASLASNKPGIIEAGGEEEAVETLIRHALLEWSEVEEPIRSYGYFLPSKLGSVMEKNLPDRREPWSSNMMIRINLPRKFFARIAPQLMWKNKGKKHAFSLEIVDINEIISFEFSPDGLQLGDKKLQEHLILTRRQLSSAVFGYHQQVTEKNYPELSGLFPFYFPLWILDHS